MQDFLFRLGTAVVIGANDPVAETIATKFADRGSRVVQGRSWGDALAQLDPGSEVHTFVALARTRTPDIGALLDLLTAVLPRLRHAQGSVLVVTSSQCASETKGDLDEVLREIAAIERAHGVRVNQVVAGHLADDLLALDMPPESRLTGTLADVAEAVCFLASDRAGYISGQCLAVNGGAPTGERRAKVDAARSG
ncbi:SDR family oxidoreductase [Actinomadura sp. LD22]|uniref:SDR family oxidoreductase n=1 Tax=Actinomadura physcomitrii TaxID=2650748 RepID=A0A6I4M6F7_9ACTN|nr:SDR family oxidoreductase [Actinomadura physcomitrii]MVZ99863.1 SDR family oxidoreductase [Actinomadura physcomitrii]